MLPTTEHWAIHLNAKKERKPPPVTRLPPFLCHALHAFEHRGARARNRHLKKALGMVHNERHGILATNLTTRSTCRCRGTRGKEKEKVIEAPMIRFIMEGLCRQEFVMISTCSPVCTKWSHMKIIWVLSLSWNHEDTTFKLLGHWFLTNERKALSNYLNIPLFILRTCLTSILIWGLSKVVNNMSLLLYSEHTL